MAEKVEEKKPKKAINYVLILQIVFAVINIGVVGAGAGLVYVSTIGYQSPRITEVKLAEKADSDKSDITKITGPLIYTMDRFTVNLGSGESLKEPKRTLQFEVNLELLNKEGFEEVINNGNRAKARDRILRILGSKSFYELETIQGKLFLKDQIASEVNTILDKGIVKDVYFTQFVVQ